MNTQSSRGMTWDQYHNLQELVDTARDRLLLAEGRSGSHYELIHVLASEFGRNAWTREEAIPIGQQLLDEFIAAQLV